MDAWVAVVVHPVVGERHVSAIHIAPEACPYVPVALVGVEDHSRDQTCLAATRLPTRVEVLSVVVVNDVVSHHGVGDVADRESFLSPTKELVASDLMIRATPEPDQCTV